MHAKKYQLCSVHTACEVTNRKWQKRELLAALIACKVTSSLVALCASRGCWCCWAVEHCKHSAVSKLPSELVLSDLADCRLSTEAWLNCVMGSKMQYAAFKQMGMRPSVRDLRTSQRVNCQVVTSPIGWTTVSQAGFQATHAESL